ncbi:hypothetical protein RUM43_014303 [Polyplax serrata]|uniref:C-CAP/cofactor C-like domain-containing protein n=1 Tax=Polyplax serrata TaxID=468196 RepID=A0AAN8PII5_POLSC
MFKNCCGCQSKKANRKDSEDKGDENETKEKSKETVECVKETAQEIAKVVAQAQAPKFNEGSKEKPVEVVQRLTSSMKKPKPRLSISCEVKIIPTNFPDDLEDIPYEEEAETSKKDSVAEVDEKSGEDNVEDDDDDVEDEDPESITISVKNIDGKIIRKSVTEEELIEPPAPDVEARTISPLSDEVFVAGEKSHLELPLHNLGVKLPVSPPGANESLSPKKHPSRSQKRVSMPAVLPRWLSDEEESGGVHEPPATPVARDELALRRHRFFSELLSVAQAANEHRVRFDPFGPSIEIIGEGEARAQSQAQVKEFESLLNRLEEITLRLEKAVPLLEKGADALGKTISLTKSIEDLLDEHLTPTERENLQLLINSQDSGAEEDTTKETKDGISDEKDDFIIISPDSSADFEELNERDLIFPDDEGLPLESDKGQNTSDKSENSSNSQNTVVIRVVDGGPGEKEVTRNLSDDLPDPQDLPQSELPDEDRLDITNSQSTLKMSVQGFQQVLQGPFASYLQASSQIGGDVAEHAKIVQEAFQAQLQYLSLAAQSGKPSQSEEMKLLQPTSQRIEAIQSYREKHRTSNYFNHLSAISESIPALGWVTVSPAPAPYVKEMNDAGQFYTNRVLKDWKEKDKVHVDWTKAWVQTLSELQAFVKQYHTTGLVWGGTTAPRVGGAPPPPPPGGMPPPPPMLDLGDVAPTGGQDRSALFAEINQGENITRNLKKVTPDMQTHKNPGMRAGPAPFKPPPASIQNQVPRPFKAPSPPEKPPKFAREGKKWFIEYQKGNHNLVVENAEMNNVLYVFKCTDSTLVVKGKINSIFLDSCKKTAVVFDSVVSSIEFVNCQSVQMQVLGMVPTISIDKTDGCQIYLSQESMNVEIVSSKSSEMNVLIPTGSGDFKEYPVPEQFKTTVNKQGLATSAVENKG